MLNFDLQFAQKNSELIDLCQSQMMLLSQGLKAVGSAIYVTKAVAGGESHQTLVPLLCYPSDWEQKQSTIVVEQPITGQQPWKIEEVEAGFPYHRRRELDSLQPQKIEADGAKLVAQTDRDLNRQVIVPLIYDRAILGLLVTRRQEREWNAQELAQIEKIAETIAIALKLQSNQQQLQQQLQAQQNQLVDQHNRIDDLVHQLRNPVTALKTFGRLLLKRLLPEDKNYRVAEGILQTSDRLAHLLQQFEDSFTAYTTVDYTQANASHQLEDRSSFLLPGLTTQTVSVVDVVEPLINSFRGIAAERGVELQAYIGSNLPPVTSNGRALAEVLSNLIDNALKYTPEGGKVIIKTGLQRDDRQGIAIIDTGWGIPPEDQPHIFERHYRGVQGQGDLPGSGIGLAIVKDLVEQIQGTIELISPNGQSNSSELPGTTFVVWLPLASTSD